jgi:hypothetical protein
MLEICCTLSFGHDSFVDGVVFSLYAGNSRVFDINAWWDEIWGSPRVELACS